MRRVSRTMRFHSCTSRSVLTEGLRQMSMSGTAAECSAASQRWHSAQEASFRRSSRTMTCLNLEDDAVEPMVSTVWRDQEQEDETLGEASQLLGTGFLVLGDGAGEGAESLELEALLNQLKEEPQDGEEVVAKFSMYEAYGGEVERMRAQVFSFHQEHHSQLPAAVARKMEQELKAVDSNEAMGIPDGTRDWFVYHMMKQAERNNRRMEKVLKGFEQKLEFLAQSAQTDCPVCMEPFSPERSSETLGCCHCVCHECWEKWSAVMHGRPFCPLCRAAEFVSELAARNGMSFNADGNEMWVSASSLQFPSVDVSARAASVPHHRARAPYMLSRVWAALGQICFAQCQRQQT